MHASGGELHPTPRADRALAAMKSEGGEASPYRSGAQEYGLAQLRGKSHSTLSRCVGLECDEPPAVCERFGRVKHRKGGTREGRKKTFKPLLS